MRRRKGAKRKPASASSVATVAPPTAVFRAGVEAAAGKLAEHREALAAGVEQSRSLRTRLLALATELAFTAGQLRNSADEVERGLASGVGPEDLLQAFEDGPAPLQALRDDLAATQGELAATKAELAKLRAERAATIGRAEPPPEWLCKGYLKLTRSKNVDPEAAFKFLFNRIGTWVLKHPESPARHSKRALDAFKPAEGDTPLIETPPEVERRTEPLIVPAGG